MPRKGIEYLDVALVAHRLTTEGKSLTVDSVRAGLGGTGSKGTIAPLLKRWKKEHQSQAATAGLGLPPELVKSVQMIHEQVQAHAEIRVTALQEKHAQLVLDLTEQLDGFQRQNAGLIEKGEAQDNALRAIQDELAHSKARLQEQEVWNAEAKAANVGLQQRNTDLVSANTHLGSLLEKNRAGLEHFQEVTAQQRAEERRATEQREARLEKELAEAQALAQQQAATLTTLRSETQHLQVSLDESKKALEESRRQLGAISREREQAGFELREITQQHAALIKRHDAASTALSAAQTAQAVAEGEKRQIEERLQQIEDKHGNVVNNLQIALQEKASLEGQLRQLSAGGLNPGKSPST